MPANSPATSPAPTAERPSRSAAAAPARGAGIAAAAILAAACAFHLYWAAGGAWGGATAYGSPDLPPQAATAVVAVLIGAAVVVLLARIGVLATPLPPRAIRTATWALVAVFAIAGVNNMIQPQDAYARDWHLLFFGPLLLALAALCAVVARSDAPR